MSAIGRMLRRAASWRPSPAVMADIGLGLLVTGVVAAAITADLPDIGYEGTGPDAVSYLFAVGFGALMLVRRRWPVGVLVASTVLLAGYYILRGAPIGLAVPLAAALYTAAEQGRTRWAIGIAAFAVVSSTAYRLAEGDDPAYLLGYETAATVTLMAAVIALGEAVRSRRGWQGETRRRLRLAAAEREREAARRVEEERARIGRELHDVLAHTVSVISIQADVAAEALRDDPDAAETAIGAIRSASRDAMGELRATLGLLREGATEPRAPVPGLAQLDRVVGAAAESGLAVRVTVEGEPVQLPAVVDAAAHRIVQESITNVLRHAGATRAEVRLGYAPGALTVTVTDDGQGGSAKPSVNGAGWGIKGMRERATVLGGRLEAGGRPDGGFAVTATLPIGGAR
jgi:signal transduction histidine kinase